MLLPVTRLILLTFAPNMKKAIFILTTILAALFGGNTSAQNYSQLLDETADGLRYIDEDGNYMDRDSTTVDKNTVPIGIKMWTIDSHFGNRTEIPVDTLMHQFQNIQFTDGLNGEYNYLGNIGSPRLSRIFFHRQEASQFIFTDPYDYFIVPVDKYHFLNTKSPFANISYFSGGNKQNGEDRFMAYFGVNANRRLNFGFSFDYVYGRGMYNNQATSLFNSTFFSSYQGDKYDYHFLFSKNHMKMAENGGITDDRYIVSPEEISTTSSYTPSDIPTNLESTWNRNDNYHIFFTHRYNLGFYKEPEDTAQHYDDFIPVTSFIHTLQYDNNERQYIAYETPDNYYVNDFFGSDYQRDITSYTSLKNTFAIALREGFNKWAKAGLTAFINYEMRTYHMVDTLSSAEERYNRKYTDNILRVGGELLKEQGKTLHYRVYGETALTGDEAGTFNVTGNADLNFRLFKDTIQLAANAYIKHINPSFYFRHYHSRHIWWDNDLSKELRTRIEGEFKSQKAGLQLSIGVENITNYTYFDNAAEAYTTDGTTTYLHNVKVSQCSDNIQVLSATLKKDFALGILHWDNEITYQKSSNQDVLPLPDLSLYSNLYLKFQLAKKVLSVELGADVRYFTKYYAPDYSPAIGQFYLQNPNDRIEIGNYPIVNLYANLHLKHTRIYAMVYHVSEGIGNSSYFLAPHYPINPMWFKFGLSWNFFN